MNSEEALISTTQDQCQLTDTQKARTERNRQKALLLRHSKVVETSSDQKDHSKSKVRRVIDTGGGFLLEEEEDAGKLKSNANSGPSLVHPAAPLVDPNDLCCDECGSPFNESYLQLKFNVNVCDNCRDMAETHQLITRTAAKSQYLLSDVDIDKREPPLPFVLKKNPHNPRWGDMKLYLEAQVAQRAIELWGDEEGMEEERRKRANKREEGARKKYDKRLKDLRKQVRSSLYQKKEKVHEHKYGEEVHCPESDSYVQTCLECNHSITYEKL